MPNANQSGCLKNQAIITKTFRILKIIFGQVHQNLKGHLYNYHQEENQESQVHQGVEGRHRQNSIGLHFLIEKVEYAVKKAVHCERV